MKQIQPNAKSIIACIRMLSNEAGIGMVTVNVSLIKY